MEAEAEKLKVLQSEVEKQMSMGESEYCFQSYFKRLKSLYQKMTIASLDFTG